MSFQHVLLHFIYSSISIERVERVYGSIYGNLLLFFVAIFFSFDVILGVETFYVFRFDAFKRLLRLICNFVTSSMG